MSKLVFQAEFVIILWLLDLLYLAEVKLIAEGGAAPEYVTLGTGGR